MSLIHLTRHSISSKNGRLRLISFCGRLKKHYSSPYCQFVALTTCKSCARSFFAKERALKRPPIHFVKTMIWNKRRRTHEGKTYCRHRLGPRMMYSYNYQAVTCKPCIQLYQSEMDRTGRSAKEL